MAEVVDSIIADLQVRYQQYVKGFDEATAAHGRFTKSIPQIGALAGISGADAQKYADRHAKASNDIGDAAERTTSKVKRAAKERADAAVASERKQTDAAKAAAAERVRAAEAEDARYAALTERAAARSGVRPGSGKNIGATVPRTGSGQAGFADTGAAAEVAAEKEINHLLADQFDLRARAAVLQGFEKRSVQDEISYLARINTYKRAGLAEDEAILRAEAEILVIEKARAEQQQKIKAGGQSGLRQAVGAAAFGYSPSGAAVGGLAAAAVVALGLEAIKSAVDYGKALKDTSEQLGISTKELQVYQAAARDAGATQDQLSSGLSQFYANLGKAREGSQEQVALFKALGINVKTLAQGDALPTIVDRLSSVKNKLDNTALGTRLFGEEYRHLTGFLSGGNAKLNEFADGLERSGSVLSEADIQKLDEIGKKFDEIKTKIGADTGRIAAQNADGILTLANAFEALAGSIADSLEALGRFYNSPVGQAVKNGAIDAFEAITGIPASELIARGQPGAAPKTKAAASSGAGAGGAVQRGDVSDSLLKKLLAGKGKSAETLANEADARTRRFNDTISRYQDEQQAALAQQTQDAEERNELSRKQLQRDLAREIADLKLRATEDIRKGAEKGLTESRLAQAISAAQAAEAEKENVLNLQNTIEHLRNANDTALRGLDYQDDLLRSQEAIATTAAERRAIEQKLLDNARQRETLDANTIIARADQGDSTVSASDLAGAKDTLRTQNTRFEARRKAVNASTRGPGGDYLDSLPTNIDKVGEAFERAEVRGLTAFDDKLTSTVSKMLHLHGIAGQFLEDLIKIGIERDLIGPIANGLFGPANGGGEGGGSGGGGFFGSIAKFGASLFGGGVGSTSASLAGGRASGGNVVGGRTYLVGEHGPEPVTFGQSGKVYPTGKLRDVTGAGGGGTTIVQHISVDSRNSVTPDGFAKQIIGIANQLAQQGDAQTRTDVRRGFPAASARYGRLGTTG